MMAAMPGNRPAWPWLVLLATVCTVISCGANLSAGSPTPPGGVIKPSAAAADELEKNVRNQFFDPSKKDFRLVVNNDQITSYLALRYRSLSLENPQVWFAQDRVFLRGTYTGLCLFHPDILIVAAPAVSDKKILVNVQQISVGAFALPQDWLPTVSKSVADTIQDAQLNLDFDQVQIRNGDMVVTGSKHAS
jgi:uncharacterized protein YpmS